MSVDLQKIKEELKILPKFEDQICLQGTKDNLDPFWGIGKWLEKHEKGYKETDFNTFIFDMPYVNSILSDLKMYRTRVMNLKSKTCYTYHKDLSKRIHIPVETNKDCFMIRNNEVRHYPADGNYYVVDTTQYHTALNASMLDRIHIVGVI